MTNNLRGVALLTPDQQQVIDDLFLNQPHTTNLPLLDIMFRMSGPLYTDKYMFTACMALWAWKQGLHRTRVRGYMAARRPVFGDTNFIAVAGQELVLQWYRHLKFSTRHLDYMAQHRRRSDGQPLFPEEYLKYLENFRPEATIAMVPEGTLIAPHVPLMQVEAPFDEFILLESAPQNLINISTKVATEVTLARLAAKDTTLIEGGLRRAPDIMALASTRAAYIAGMDVSSNMTVGMTDGIPTGGTTMHSYYLLHDREEDGHEACLRALQGDAAGLLDTTADSLRSLERLKAASERTGIIPTMVRQDSGELGDWTARLCERIATFGPAWSNVGVMPSGDLDSLGIWELQHELRDYREDRDFPHTKAKAFMEGTRALNGRDKGAMSIFYKMCAKYVAGQGWVPVMKTSSEPKKATLPGANGFDAYRMFDERGRIQSYVINDAGYTAPAFAGGKVPEAFNSINIDDPTQKKLFAHDRPLQFLYEVPVIEGQLTRPLKDVFELRDYMAAERKLINPVHVFQTTTREGYKKFPLATGLTQGLYENFVRIKEKMDRDAA